MMRVVYQVSVVALCVQIEVKASWKPSCGRWCVC